MVAGQVPLGALSLTKATVGVLQLSAASVTTVISDAGTSATAQNGPIAVGLLAVGASVSFKVMSWVTFIVFPQSSVTE